MFVAADYFSRTWVHESFNNDFMRLHPGDVRAFIGNESSNFFRYYKGDKYQADSSAVRRFIQLLEVLRKHDTNHIIFLVLSRREVLYVLLLRLLGVRVEYAYHKLNLRTRITKWYWRAIYSLLEVLDVRALCFERPHQLFKKYRVLPSPFRASACAEPIYRSTRRIAFVGAPDEGKQYDEAVRVSSELAIQLIVFSDGKVDAAVQRPHTNHINDCDFIWGFYHPDYYQGTQSGITVVADQSCIPLLTFRNVGFGAYSRACPKMCVSFSDPAALKNWLNEYYTV